MIIKSNAPGKLILIGEYVVLEGVEALVASVDRYATVTVEKSDSNMVNASTIEIIDEPFKIENNKITFNDIEEEKKKKLTFFKTTFDFCLQNIPNDISDRCFRVDINTQSFYSDKLSAKLGFGSSAALTVALVKAFFKLSSVDINKSKNQDLLFNLSLGAHKKAQGNLGSGIDIAASSYGGVLKYVMGKNSSGEKLIPKQIDVWSELPTLTIFTGKSESTRKMVFGVNQLKQEKPKVYNELMKELALTSREGCAAYKDKNLFGFMNAIKTYNTQMDMLGKNSGMPIISEVHQKIAATVQKNIGVYKPSGAGSGDIGIAFAETAEQIKVIRKAVETEGFQSVDVKLGLQD